MALLRQHRRQESGCKLGNPSLKRGLDEEQLSKIDLLGRSRKSPHVSDIEKWMLIWDIVTYGETRPSHPCEYIHPRMVLDSLEASQGRNLSQ